MSIEKDSGQELCPDCGLCCDGSIYRFVAVTPNEEKVVRALGMDVVEDDGMRGYCLPCTALDGTRCTIYPDRFTTCRTFECQLLLDVRAGKKSVATAKKQIAEAKRLAAKVRAEARPGESVIEARGRALDAEAGPKLTLAAIALEYFSDRHFRKPHQKHVGALNRR